MLLVIAVVMLVSVLVFVLVAGQVICCTGVLDNLAIVAAANTLETPFAIPVAAPLHIACHTRVLNT